MKLNIKEADEVVEKKIVKPDKSAKRILTGPSQSRPKASLVGKPAPVKAVKAKPWVVKEKTEENLATRSKGQLKVGMPKTRIPMERENYIGGAAISNTGKLGRSGGRTMLRVERRMAW